MNVIRRIELASFLKNAKRNTYASGKAAVKLPDGSKQFFFSRGLYVYTDTFSTRKILPTSNEPRERGEFWGQEEVSLGSAPVWSMEYHGGTEINDDVWESPERIYSFLREALMRMPLLLPVRGPAYFEGTGDHNGFQYFNDSFGSLSRFSGIEKITRQYELISPQVYFLGYSGGEIAGK